MAKVNKRDLQRQYDLLKKQGKKEARAALERAARKAGFAILAGAQDRVPVQHGILRLSLSVGDKNNVFNLSMQGRNAEITVGSGLEYAEWVEDGYKQKAGQFVPGYWKGKRFKYDPDAYKKFLDAVEAFQADGGEGDAPSIFDYGMILTGKKIPGVHFLARSKEEVESIQDEIIQEEIDEMLRRLFDAR